LYKAIEENIKIKDTYTFSLIDFVVQFWQKKKSPHKPAMLNQAYSACDLTLSEKFMLF
jgi:hypothetical protein